MPTQRQVVKINFLKAYDPVKAAALRRALLDDSTRLPPVVRRRTQSLPPLPKTSVEEFDRQSTIAAFLEVLGPIILPAASSSRPEHKEVANTVDHPEDSVPGANTLAQQSAPGNACLTLSK